MRYRRKESSQKRWSPLPGFNLRTAATLVAIVFSINLFISDIVKLSLLTSESVNYEMNSMLVGATSINYGISQQPITDMNMLMPNLCQNQSVICEGSFCIPGVRKCVCDLRMPVQFGKYCLRQVDIETKCFVTSQCNHTIKDAVCIDQNSNSILTAETSKFKLDQWHQLNELKQQSAATISKDVPKQAQPQQPQTRLIYSSGSKFAPEPLVSNLRNSPYEISYNTPELLLQNHTRRKLNAIPHIGAFLSNNQPTPTTTSVASNTIKSDPARAKPEAEAEQTTAAAASAAAATATNSPDSNIPTTLYTPQAEASTNSDPFQSTANYQSDSTTPGQSSELSTLASTTSVPAGGEFGARKKTIRKPSWPPGRCSCPFGYMFDSMLRKCLAVSLADSHCQTDTDCKQILMTHCSQETRKCECDEPLVWDQKESACVRPSKEQLAKSSGVTDGLVEGTGKRLPGQNEPTGFVENLIPPLVLAKLFPDYLFLVMLFIVLIIIAVLLLFKLTASWFSSSSSSALISPKNSKKKGKGANSSANNLPPRSPYATLRRPDHKPASQLANFTQATRGRILNYDFEQDGSAGCQPDESHNSPSSGQPIMGGTLRHPRTKDARIVTADKSATLKLSSSNKGHKHQQLHIVNNNNIDKQPKKPNNINGGANPKLQQNDSNDQLLELNDNISISQLESESKSDSSVLAIPGPPTTQQPPYMMGGAMKGQGSAIAAAAAAVANKRMQRAQKKNSEQQQQPSTGRLVNGSSNPVFL